MFSVKEEAEKQITRYSDELIGHGYKVSEISEALYNYELGVSDDITKLKLLVYFGKKGVKIILQGNKDSVLYNNVDSLIFGESLFDNKITELDEPESYIGTDESGKGDYFGPLVIAGVFVDKISNVKLKKLGVRDSKLISDNSISDLAIEIKKIVGNNFNIITINPQKYNELYSKIKNVNKLLGWAHAKVLENIAEVTDAKEAISDKFGDESLIVNSLQEKGTNLKLHQFTKAEKYTAVAAASILARNEFSNWFKLQNKKIKMTLPKGASSKVEEIAHRVIRLYGKEKLNELVKLHFKTTGKIISI